MILFSKLIVPFRKFLSNYEGFKCRISILIVLVLLIFLSGFNLSCSNYPKVGIKYREGEITTTEIEFNGLTREFRFYIPNGFDIKAEEKHPLILILHGFNQPVSSIIQTYKSMKSKANADGTILVYPQSTGDETENTLSWNPLYGDLDDIDESLNDVDDVGYLSYLIDVFLGNMNCDPDRIYVTGTSMGGAMTYALSCHISERLAAVAPAIMQIGKVYVETHAKAKPLPIMIINGTADPLVNPDGSSSGSQEDVRIPFVSNDENLEYWKKRNHITGDGVISKLDDAVTEIFKGEEANSYIEKYVWESKSDNDIIFLKVINGGHWLPAYFNGVALDPSNLGGWDGSYLGNWNNDLNCAGVIYDFLLSYKKQ